jgi:methionyl aminopeptidase
MTSVKSAREIELMRTSGSMLSTILSILKKQLTPGMSTKDLAEIAKKELRLLGGQPTFLGYQGFPDVLCVSINDEVVHGVPSTTKIIKLGDIVSMDFGVTYQGLITDSALTVVAGTTKNHKIMELLDATRISLEAGIASVKAGIKVGDLSSAIESVLKEHRLGIVRDLVGHGVGHKLHELPNIPNYGRPGLGPTLQAGMTIAIEPMAALGKHQVYVDTDGWTVVTRDHSLSAHFEQTILITDEGSEILTPI